MDFSRGFLIRDGNELKVQGSWTPVTPAKPIPTRPRSIIRENQTARQNWPELSGFPAEVFRGSASNSNWPNGEVACFNSTISVDQNREFNNWESALAGKIKVPDPTIGMSNANAQEGWHNIGFTDLLERLAPTENFPFLLPGNDNKQPQFNSSDVLFQDQTYSPSSSRSGTNQQPQLHQNNFPDPFGATTGDLSSTSRPIYDLNYSPQTIGDTASQVNRSLQSMPVTPEKSTRKQHPHFSDVNMPIPLTSPDNGSRMHHSQPLDEVSIDKTRFLTLDKENTSIQFIPVTPAKGSKVQYNQPFLDEENAPLTQLLRGFSNGYQSASVTPGKETTFQHNQPSELADIFQNGRSQEDVFPKAHNNFELHSQGSCLESVVNSSPVTPEKQLQPTVGSTCDALSTPSKENHLHEKREDNGIDLNKTPKQKPRKKKYTPKVVREGKPKRTPKSAVKQTTTKENKTEKRKYVRRKGINTPNTPSTDVVGDSSGGMQCPVTGSCKRSLNFGLKDQGNESHEKIPRHQEEDQSNNFVNTAGCTLSIPDSQVSDLLNINKESYECTTLQFSHSVDKMVERPLTSVAFDLNHSATQMLSGFLPPEIAPQPTRRELLRKNLTFLGRDEHDPMITSEYHEVPVPLGVQDNINCGWYLPPAEGKQTKRRNPQTPDEGRLRSLAQFDSSKVYQEMLQANEDIRNGNSDMLFPDIYKKRRTETTTSKSRLGTVEDGHKEATAHYTKNANKLYTSQWNSSHLCHASSQLSRHHNADPMTTFGKLKSSESELVLTIRQTEMKTRKRSKGHTRVRDFASLTEVTQCNNLQSPLRSTPTSHDRRITEMSQETQYSMQSPTADNPATKARNKYSMEKSNRSMVSFSSTKPTRLEELQSAVYGHRRYSAKSRGSRKVVQQFNSPIDELIQKLNCLSMSDENHMVSANRENALVPFKGDDRIVPYQGIFDPIKKRKPRPKVDLDSETNRVWMLLMGKEATESDETDDIKKQKWWEEERRVFRGRAESFIARMHLIQGDRRFTRWNGSVLDSVIGVFLTQNVSDHLSSSAFMSLAARFPPMFTSNDRTFREETSNMYVEEPEITELESGNTKWHNKIATEPVGSQGSQSSVTLHETDHAEDKEMDNTSESFGCNTDGGCSSGVSDKDFSTCEEPPKIKAGRLMTGVGCASFAEADDGRIVEVESSGISSQNSDDSTVFQVTVGDTNASEGRAALLEADNRTLDDVASSQNCDGFFLPKKDEVIRSCSDSNSEEEDPKSRYKDNVLNNSTSFMELLRTNMIQECHTPGIERLPIDLNSETCYNQSESRNLDKRLNMGRINVESDSYSFQPPGSKYDHIGAPIISSTTSVQIISLDAQCQELMGEQSRSSLPLTGAFEENRNVADMGKNHPMEENVGETSEQNISSNARSAYLGVPYSSFDKVPVHHVISSEQGMRLDKQPNPWENIQSVERSKFEGNQYSKHEVINAQAQRSTMQQVDSNSPNFSGETLDVVESPLLLDKECSKGDDASGLKEHVHPSKLSHKTSKTSKKPNGKPAKEKKKAVDWDYLRKDAYKNCGKRERTHDTMDSLNWEAVRCADVSEIAKAIKERGMNNMLAERIKAFLDRLDREHGSIDLEWLRDAPPDKVKEYLLSVRGLGLKSVECVRLLTLHHLAFPVDTNVGRIAVRLGWVPLQPLPESIQLHLLEMYPMLETIQKYLWPRLCTLDQRTLYELHYQLITFGKVFCTKSKPNCNACPMRAECKHFASAFASAKLALPGPEEKSIVSSNVPAMANQVPAMSINPMSLPPPEATMATPSQINLLPLNPTDANMLSETRIRIEKSEPIIEVPASPEPECNEVLECDMGDIEDTFWEDPDEIPIIKLNLEEFASNLQNYMQENNMKLQDGDMSKALVTLSPEAASLPPPKLKNVGRLRTEHLVYELKDDHPLLELKGMEKRVPGEVSPYLLAIWTPGETAESIEPPKACGASQISGKLCCETTCFSCNAIREAYTQTVRGTLLIPCRTAMRGSFPLNGTYFQVNEVFADHESSLNPIDVPRAWLWELHTRMVYFGTSVSTIFKGQSTSQIQACFWKGYVCVRGFDQRTRAPRPLMARLHFPASKLVANAKLAGKAKGKEKEKGKFDKMDE